MTSLPGDVNKKKGFISGGGGTHSLHPPPRSATAVPREKQFRGKFCNFLKRVQIRNEKFCLRKKRTFVDSDNKVKFFTTRQSANGIFVIIC